jgi:hypothetical protein
VCTHFGTALLETMLSGSHTLQQTLQQAVLLHLMDL